MTALSPQQMHYNWLMNIIDSCTDCFHFDCIEKLIAQFKVEYAQETKLHQCLEELKDKRLNHINNSST